MFDIQGRAAAIAEKLTAFSQMNHRLAVDEPANDFESAFNDYELLKQLHEELKQITKVIGHEEGESRKAIATSLSVYFGDGIKEGTNSYTLSNGRKIKFGNNFNRSVDPALIQTAREKYDAVPAEERGSVLFDNIFRIKYEINKKEYGKLMQGGSALVALGTAITTKPSTPTIELD